MYVPSFRNPIIRKKPEYSAACQPISHRHSDGMGELRAGLGNGPAQKRRFLLKNLPLHFAGFFAFYLFPALLMFQSGCTPVENLDPVPDSAVQGRILIKTVPTEAEIFINDQYLGTSPIKTDLWYFDHNIVNIKAEPIYPHGQFVQNIYLRYPPIPDILTIYMNHRPAPDTDLADAPPPEEPLIHEVVVYETIQADPLPPDTLVIENWAIEQVPISVPTLYFDFDSTVLLDSELEKLQELLGTLSLNEDYHLEIHGYADLVGEPEYNKNLSLRRSLVVQEYLIKNGIAKNRMETFGHGQRASYKADGTDLGYDRNRTVEFNVIIPHRIQDNPPTPEPDSGLQQDESIQDSKIHEESNIIPKDLPQEKPNLEPLRETEPDISPEPSFEAESDDKTQVRFRTEN